MHRSGSTLVWQVARHLLEGTPGLRNPRRISTDEFPGAAADPGDLLMVKVHFRRALTREHFPSDGARYLYTYRDVRDVVASLFRKGELGPDDPGRGADQSRLIARRELRGDEIWNSKPDIWVGRYEDFRNDVPNLVRSLADYLGVAVDSSRVAEIVRDVDPQSQERRAEAARDHGIDDNLRVTVNHITDGRVGAWRDTLTTDELEAIEELSATWLFEHNYPLETPLGRRKTAGLRKARRQARSSTSASLLPAPLAPELRRRSRQRWAIPLLATSAVLALLGVLAAFTVPAASAVSWVLSLGCALVGAYLRGRRDRALAPRWRR